MTNRSSLLRLWFPLALIVLLLLALPGAILLALNLLGKETGVNGWLRERFELSYHFFPPWWAGILLLLAPLLIVLLYFLKLKRRPMQVPSTFLWRKSIEDLHVNSLFQWLRNNVLLLLQLLILLSLIYAVLAFQLHGRSGQAKHYILMVDNSASMSAKDVSPTRLDAAKKAAIDEIDAHGDTDYGMVIVFNSTAEILRSYTNDRGVLRRAVESIPQTQQQTRMEDALRLADSLANPNRPTDSDSGKTASPIEGVHTAVHLYSDGRFPDVADFARGNLNFEFHPIGEPGAVSVNNVAILNVTAERSRRDPSRLTVLVEVANYRPEPVSAKVRLELSVNGQRVTLLDQVAELSGHSTDEKGQLKETRGTVQFQLAEVSEQANVVLHARLVDHEDNFALDDEAWRVVGLIRKARVLIVDGGDRAVNAFFDQPATQKVARVVHISHADLDNDDKYGKPARNGEYDLVVFDKKAPAKKEDLPLANAWFIDCLPPPWKREDYPPLDGVRAKLNKHPLLRNQSTLTDIVVFGGFRFDLKRPDVPNGTPRLLETEGDTALLFLLARQSFTDLVMTFSFFNDKGLPMTTWVTDDLFPSFLRNVLYGLGNVQDGTGEDEIRPGQPKPLRPDVALKEIKVRAPGGSTDTLERGSRPDFIYGKTDRVGVYDVEWDGAVQRSFAVNLLDALESNLQPRSKFRLGTEEVSAGEARSQPRELWKWLVLAALAFVLLEWYIYNRRVYV